MSKIEEINSLTEEYYDSLPDGIGLKPLMRWNKESLDSLDNILDELKGKKPSLNLPDDKEEDELTAWLREKTERQREMERKGKIKVRI